MPANAAAAVAKTGAPPSIRIRALVPIEADQVRIEPGTEAEIRSELVADLVRVGAAEVIDPPIAT